MIITPIVAPSLAGLTATPALRGNLLTWTASADALLFGAEVWAATVNNRASATKIATIFDNTFMHQATAGVTWYYWIRAVSTYQRADGAWYPVSATAGVASTTLLAQTADFALGSVTSVSIVQSVAPLVQTSYGSLTNLWVFSYLGTGNTFIIDARHFANLTLTTVGTSQSAEALCQLAINEYFIYTTGTITVTNGSAIITGVGTSWLSNVSTVIMLSPSSVRYVVASVDSDTQITLAGPFAGATASGQAYIGITAGSNLMSLVQSTNKFEIMGSYLVCTGAPFSHRIPVSSSVGRMYDILLNWQLNRDNATWSISNSSILKTLILEEIKR